MHVRTAPSIRRLLRRPWLALLKIGVLSVAVAVSSLAFSLIEKTQLRSAPFPEPNRLTRAVLTEQNRLGSSRLDIEDFRSWSRASSVQGVAGLAHSRRENVFNVTRGTTPFRVHGAFATANLFDVLGATPAIGRLWSATSSAQGVILDHAVWAASFSADSSVIGQEIRFNGAVSFIMGVLPRDFRVGHPEGAVHPGTTIGMWAPMSSSLLPNVTDFDEVVVRLNEGVPVSRAEAELGSLLERPSLIVRLEPVNAPVMNAVRSVAAAFVGIVIVVVVLAMVNLAGVELADVPSRQREMGLRLALGGGARSLIRVIGREAMVVGMAGAAVALMLAVWLGDLLAFLLPNTFIFIRHLPVHWSAFAFGLGVTVCTLFLVNAVPLWFALRTDPSLTLRRGTGISADAGSQRFVRTVVAAQLGLAYLLCIAVFLLFRSTSALLSIPTGFDVSNVLAFEIHQPPESSQMPSEYFRDISTAVEGVVGVTDVSLTSSVPFRARDYYHSDWNRRVVEPGYFDLLGVRFVEGSGLPSAGGQDNALVAVISQELARREFPDGSPIGRMLEDYRIVGVVEDVRHQRVDEPPIPVVYSSMWQTPDPRMSLLVGTRGEDAMLVQRVREAIWRQAPGQPIEAVASLTDLYQGSAAVGERLFVFRVLVTLAALALVLAMSGVYGAFAHFVAQRRREIGIRSALGASGTDVVGLVVRQSLAMTAVGLLLGLAGTPLLERTIGFVLFGVGSIDPLSAFLGGLTLLAVTTAAVSVPARAAVQVSPLEILRSD